MSTAGISGREFELFSEFFYAHTGIRFPPTKRYFVDRRLVERMEAGGHATFGSYLRSLERDLGGTELQSLVDAMTVNETYFFRDEEQLDLVVRELLPEMCEGRPGGDQVRIWSMPCSSGEEPYSVAIKLLEGWPDVDRYEVEIFGSDIDSTMVARAREGRFSERSIHRLSASARSKYFRKERPEGWRIVEALRESVDFRRVNAMDRMAMGRYQDMDVILCRNMLIYFDDVSRRRVVDALWDALRPGGALLLGASESLGATSRRFDIERRKAGAVHRRPRR